MPCFVWEFQPFVASGNLGSLGAVAGDVGITAVGGMYDAPMPSPEGQ